MNDLRNDIHSQLPVLLEELFPLIRIPSISSEPVHQPDMLKAAELLAGMCLQAGAYEARTIPTTGHPLVFASRMADPNLPTVLVYGHYDVMPVDPLDLWKTPPFEPQVRDGRIYARGSADDKGQLFTQLKAFEYLVKNNELRCNVKFLFEGEEEMGSPALNQWLPENTELLKADLILVSDTSMLGIDKPSITVGLRGLAYMEVEVTGPDHDLHSGIYGGAVANPANVLAALIASLHDENHHITIPGFYDSVQEVSASERADMARAPFDLAEYKRKLGIVQTCCEKGYSETECTGIRPTLDVNGLWSGYTGEGSKTVLPSKAFAKISMRLVPDQDPHVIAQLFAQHLQSIAPPSVKVAVREHHGGHPYVSPVNTVAYSAASLAYEKAFGTKPIPVRSGGSIPIIAAFEQALGIKSILMGFGLDSDVPHSPNENFQIECFEKGIETIVEFYREYGRQVLPNS